MRILKFKHKVPVQYRDDPIYRKQHRHDECKEMRMKRMKNIRRRLLDVLKIYLDDLLLVAGCICFTTGAEIKWGAAEALFVCGVCLTACAIIVARGGIVRR